MKQTTRKNLHRALSLFMAMVMMLSLINVTALAEGVGHEHNQDGWTCEQAPDVKELTCTKEEHVHTDDCYQGEVVKELTCGLEETEGHAHTDDCYTTERDLTCDIPENHHHTVDCYQIGEPGEEMQIDGEWYSVVRQTCTIPEGHVHDDSCYTSKRILSCGLEEAAPHVHGDECYTEGPSLSCGLEEHTHTDECYTVIPGEWTCIPPEEPVDPETTDPDTETTDPETEIDEAVQNVIDIFNAILESGDFGPANCLEAQHAYDALSDEQKTQVQEILGEENFRLVMLGEAQEDSYHVYVKAGSYLRKEGDGRSTLTINQHRLWYRLLCRRGR